MNERKIFPFGGKKNKKTPESCNHDKHINLQNFSFPEWPPTEEGTSGRYAIPTKESSAWAWGNRKQSSWLEEDKYLDWTREATDHLSQDSVEQRMYSHPPCDSSAILK